MKSEKSVISNALQYNIERDVEMPWPLLLGLVTKKPWNFFLNEGYYVEYFSLIHLDSGKQVSIFDVHL